MAKHKNKHRQLPQQSPKPAPSTEGAAGKSPPSGPVTAADITTPGTAIEAISKVHSQALETATEGDIEAATKTAPPGTDGLDIVKAARELWEANELCRARSERMSRLEEGERALKESQDLLTQEQAQLAADRKALEELESSLKIKEEEVRDREDGLRVRELNAEAGFAAERRVSLQLLDQEAAAVREELSRARGLISAERADWDARWRQDDQRVRTELEQLTREQAEQHAASVRELDAQRRQFETEASQTRAALKKQQAQLDVREDVLREDREAFDLRVKQRAGAALEEAEAKYRDLEARLAAARKERDGLYERLREREEAERALGNRPLDLVKRELDALIKENKSLTDRLAKRPSEDMVARLEMLERAQEEWEADRARLSQELMASRASVARSAIAVTELESLRDQKAALETGRDLLQAALEELRKDVDERIRRSDGVSPFPSCSQMDGDDALQGRVPMFDEIPDLAAFCGDLQNRVAFDPMSGKELYYSLSDIRCFLAGMAMSRLHLLQGISGTREDEPAPCLRSCPGCRSRPSSRCRPGGGIARISLVTSTRSSGASMSPSFCRRSTKRSARATRTACSSSSWTR
jgi:hypothetical protein